MNKNHELYLGSYNHKFFILMVFLLVYNMVEFDSLMSEIELFNEKHDLDSDCQLRQLLEELGEYSESVNRDYHAEERVSELADISFVALSLLLIESISEEHAREILLQTINENNEKSESKEGSKVTKS